MTLGLDFVTGPSPGSIKADNRTFACRYTGYFSGYNLNNIAVPQGKCLTPGEAKALSQAGIAIVSNFEWYNTRAVDDGLGHAWTTQQAYSAGAWDAQTAQTIHSACGGPADKPIYFSIDFNVAEEQFAMVGEYLKGVASVIGLARTGAYGGYAVIKYLLDNDLVTWAWQTYAWSNNEWDNRTDIQQYQNGVSLDGHEVDYDRSMKPDFGQWLIGDEMLQITDPMVGSYFEEQDENHWVCTHNKYVIQYGNLKLYRNVKSGETPDLAGLTLFGLPTGNETPIDNEGNTEQPYERVKVRYDPSHKYDDPPGAGASYTTHSTTQTAPSAPVDTSALVEAINHIPDAIAPAVAAALVQAQKL